VTVNPQEANSSLVPSDVPEPTQADGEVLVDVVAVGTCGTDAEISGGGDDVKVVEIGGRS
jgi:threonine dehydrogenase-like Zn-dependent dehydrogenase